MSYRLVGYGLPKVAQDLIHDLVHKTKRVYREYRAAYRIVRNEGSDLVAVYATLSYKVVNNGSGSEGYKPKLLEEGIYNPQLISLEYGGKVFNPTPKRDLKTGVVSWEPDTEIKLAPSGATEAVDNLPNNKVCFVRWEYTLEMPQRYSAVIAVGGVTVNPMVELLALPDGFEFNASQDEENACSHAENGSTWEYKRAFVAGQHVRVWWRPR